MIIGAHVSVAGGVINALANADMLDCETFQIFTKNQNQWKEKYFSDQEVSEFTSARTNSRFCDTDLAAHDSYLINLCNPDQDKRRRASAAFIHEVDRCDHLGLAYLVFHPGACLQRSEKWGLQTIADSLNQIIEQRPAMRVKLLLETTAGQGTNLGYRFEQLNTILELIEDKGKLGVCLDTCHIFAAGYDLRTESDYVRTIEELDAIIGLTQVFAVHLNDSLRELGSRVDRHARIGEGAIGETAFRLLMTDPRFKKKSGYLEIPGGEQAFRSDLRKLKSYRE